GVRFQHASHGLRLCPSRWFVFHRSVTDPQRRAQFQTARLFADTSRYEHPGHASGQVVLLRHALSDSYLWRSIARTRFARSNPRSANPKQRWHTAAVTDRGFTRSNQRRAEPSNVFNDRGIGTAGSVRSRIRIRSGRWSPEY